MPLFLSTVHFTWLGALGIWIWAKVSSFGNQPECMPATFLTVFGHDIAVTNHSLRKASIAIYSIITVPLLNIFIIFFLGLLVVLLIVGMDLLLQSFKAYRRIGSRFLLLSGVSLMTLIEVLFVLDTEFMIHRSAALVKEGEAEWTFGQTLAMFMTIFPLIEVIRGTYRSYKRRGRNNSTANQPTVKEGVQDGLPTNRFDTPNNESLNGHPPITAQ